MIHCCWFWLHHTRKVRSVVCGNLFTGYGFFSRRFSSWLVQMSDCIMLAVVIFVSIFFLSGTDKRKAISKNQTIEAGSERESGLNLHNIFCGALAMFAYTQILVVWKKNDFIYPSRVCVCMSVRVCTVKEFGLAILICSSQQFFCDRHFSYSGTRACA